MRRLSCRFKGGGYEWDGDIAIDGEVVHVAFYESKDCYPVCFKGEVNPLGEIRAVGANGERFYLLSGRGTYADSKETYQIECSVTGVDKQ